MIYSIENKDFLIAADTFGAQLMSLRSKKTGVEYLWQGDPAYWSGRAYNLFPLIGRQCSNQYYLGEKAYPMRSHGLARYYEFELYRKTENQLIFRLCDNEETLKQYPFHFEFFTEFTINETGLSVVYRVNNTGNCTMYCALGGHPGINVPFGGGNFEDYYLEFENSGNVLQHTVADSKMMSGQTIPFALEGGARLPLKHSLFDIDAIVLENSGDAVALRSKKTDRFIRFVYRGYKYLGLWHASGKDAPYVCLEPWSVLPAQDGVSDDFSKKADMFRLLPQESKHAEYIIEIHE